MDKLPQPQQPKGLTSQLAHDVFTLRKNSADVAYYCARSMTRLGQTREAIKYLTAAISEGYSDIAGINNDPDFEGLRGEPDFKTLVEVKWEPETIQGIFADDLRVTNRSTFPITNVEVAAGGRKYRANLIQPGGSHTWRIPRGERASHTNATLKCDQSS